MAALRSLYDMQPESAALTNYGYGERADDDGARRP